MSLNEPNESKTYRHTVSNDVINCTIDRFFSADLNFLRLGTVGRGRGSEKGRAGVERTAEERREDEAWLGAQLGRSWLRRRWFRRWFWRRLRTWFRRQRTHIHGSRQGSHGHKDRPYSRALPSRGDKTRPCSRQCTNQSTGRQASSCPRASTLPGHSREACALSGREADTLPRKGARQGADKGACAGQGTCQGTGHCTKTSALPCQGALGREGGCTCPCARTRRWRIRRWRIRRWWIVTGRWTRFRRLRAFLMQRLELGRVSKSLIFNVRQHCPSTAAGQCNC
ncbi:hypothetical protein K0M31_017936 [Melipona bicolor]|uniref:Uncharacterized protein n=1 Tax=Melipona bicolor TaxID=60889 RepID=A0AA40G628_9HYME|nr:hypothetical protein K0M31_017936 [Melipona bicolor]